MTRQVGKSGMKPGLGTLGLVCQSLALLAALSLGSLRLLLLLAISGNQGLLSWHATVIRLSVHGPAPANPSPMSHVEWHSQCPMLQHHSSSCGLWLEIGLHEPALSLKKNSLPFCSPILGVWSHRRIFPIRPNDGETDYLLLRFPDCWSWEQWEKHHQGYCIKAWTFQNNDE